MGEEKILMGCWDCPICGHQGILGDVYVCPTCKNARREDVRFYLPKDAKEVTDEKEIEEAKAGVDWYCRRCSAGNPADADECLQCHHLKSYSEYRSAYGKGQEDDPNDDDASGTREHIVEEGSFEKATALAEERERKRVKIKPLVPNSRPASASWYSHLNKYPKKNFLLPIGIGAALLLSGVLAFFIFRTKEVPMTVISHSWERTISLDICRTVSEDDWSVPSGGRQTSSRRAIHHYDK